MRPDEWEWSGRERGERIMRARACGLTYKQIGEMLGVSAGRAQQLHCIHMKRQKRFEREFEPPTVKELSWFSSHKVRKLHALLDCFT